MKPQCQKCFLFALIVILTGVSSSLGQSNFQNLDFESAYGLPALSGTQVVSVSVSNALPCWTVYEGYVGGQATQVFYGGLSVGAALVTLISTTSGYSNSVIAGNYTATLDAGGGGNTLASITQTGLIPPSTSALLFLASGNVNGYLTVTVGGQNIPFIPIEAGPNNSELYGGNISAYAGLTEQLNFTETPTASDHFPIAFLDDIQFSSQGVPEPETWAVMVCGATLMGLSRWKRKR